MQKDELIQMHTLLVQIMSHLVRTEVATSDQFSEYVSLGIKPTHVHRSKGEHKRAIFVLGKELADFVAQSSRKGSLSGPAMVSHHFAVMSGTRGRATAKL